MMHLVNGHFQF
jgi:hypothetical protein